LVKIFSAKEGLIAAVSNQGHDYREENNTQMAHELETSNEVVGVVFTMYFLLEILNGTRPLVSGTAVKYFTGTANDDGSHICPRLLLFKELQTGNVTLPVSS